MGNLFTSFMKHVATAMEYPHSGKEINIRPLSSGHRRSSQTLWRVICPEGCPPTDGAGVQLTLYSEADVGV